MIRDKKDLEYYLSKDSDRFVKKPTLFDWLLRNEVWYIFHYQRHLRYIEYYQNTNNKRFLFMFHFFLYKRLGAKLNCMIFPNTVGPGFRLFHKGDFTNIKKHSVIGANCSIMPGLVIGNKHIANPQITWVRVGDNCTIGSGVKIFDEITIGNNVVIGANSVVTKSFPDNCVIGGIPARILKKID